METLQQIWERLADAGYETDKGSVHSYISFYETLLSPCRETAKRVLEIGLFNGHSLRMWESYFKNATVFGIDSSAMPHGGLADLRPMIEEGNHCIDIADATDKKFAHDRFNGFSFDVIIEDAGHDLQQQLELYAIWKDYLAPGGIYIIEDVQNIDKTRHLFEGIGGEVIDRRYIKGRYDDVLVIIRK